MNTTTLLIVLTLLVPVSAQRSRSGSVATERIFEAIGVKGGQTICEIGAGDGELSIEAARIVGPAGLVYTSELGESRVRTLTRRVAGSGLTQITVVTGDPAKTNFPDGACDALFMRNVYHHFADPAAMNASIAAAVKPGGRVAVVDFTPPGKEAGKPEDRDNDGLHGVSPETVERELKDAGFSALATEAGDERWFMVVVTKPAVSAQSLSP